MQTILQKIRTKITTFKGDIDAATKLVVSIQDQITFLQVQLKDAQSAEVGNTQITNQITTITNDNNKLQTTKLEYQATLTQTTANIEALQAELAGYAAAQKALVA